MKPKISVVMAVYNGEKYLKKAIESILNQTFKDFEFLIINDGSTDNSLSIINNYKNDKRIKLINNSVNKGLIYSLNKGIAESKGKYIARMDADDISYKERFEKQFEFMEQNEEIVLVGTGMETIFEGIPFLRKKILNDHIYESIKIKSIFQSTFVHPSIMMRSNYIKSKSLKYEDKYKNAEDYGLWTNIISDSQAINMKDILLKYRIVKKSVTRNANRDMNSRKDVFIKIYKNYFEKLGIKIVDNDLDIHFECCMIQNLEKFDYTINEKEEYLMRLKNELLKKKFKEIYINEVILLIAIKIHTYQSGNIKRINKKLLLNNKDINIKKIYIIENIKKQIKKVYK